jgi:hypothetical protein
MLIQDKTREVLGEHFKQVPKESFLKKPFSAMTYYMQQGVFKYSQGLPDIWASSFAFADSVSLQSSKIADSEGLKGEAHTQRTREIMKEVFSFKTLEEQKKDPDSLIVAIRQIAVNHAKKATGQDDRKIIQKLLGARNMLDDIIPPLNIGVILDPFLKTPINYRITSAFEYSPLGFAKGFMELKNKEQKNVVIESLARAGLASIFIMMLMALLDDDEYMNAYEMAGKDEKLSGNVYNSIIVNGYSISTDMLGFLQIPVTASLAVSKAKEGEKLSSLIDTGKVLLASTPVLDTFASFIEKDAFKKTDDRIFKEAQQGVLSTIYSRLVPNMVSQIASSVDGYERQKDYNDLFTGIQVKVPFWRENLPVKQDVMGKPIGVNPITTLLFGARVKQINNTPEVKELRRLMKQTSVATDITTIQEIKALDNLRTSQVVSKLEYDEFMTAVKVDWGEHIQEVINSFEYQQETDPEKKAELITKDKKKIIQERVRMQGIETRVADEMEKMKN